MNSRCSPYSLDSFFPKVSPKITITPSLQKVKSGDQVRVRCQTDDEKSARVHWTKLNTDHTRQKIKVSNQDAILSVRNYNDQERIRQVGDTLIIDQISPEDQGISHKFNFQTIPYSHQLNSELTELFLPQNQGFIYAPRPAAAAPLRLRPRSWSQTQKCSSRTWTISRPKSERTRLPKSENLCDSPARCDQVITTWNGRSSSRNCRITRTRISTT